MSWIPFAILAALISAGRRVYEKHLTGVFGNFSMGFVIQFFSLAPTVVLLFLIPHSFEIPKLTLDFWLPLLIIWVVLYPIQTYLLYRGLREGELSLVTPIMALLPVLNVFSSFVILGEIPSIFGFIGIIVIVIGTYFILYQGRGVSISKPVLLMIGAVFCIAIGSTLDKVAINASNPVFYSFINTLGASVVFLILIHIYREKDTAKNIRTKIKPLVFLGVLQAISYTASMYAFSYGPTSYVLAVRAGSFVLATLWGIYMLREKMSYRKKFAISCFVIGVIFLAFA